MGNIIFFDTSIGSFNHGDEIIMRSVYREFDFLIRQNFRLNFATHLVNYTNRLSDAAKIQACSSADLKFICGTDILWPNPYEQKRKKTLQISSVVGSPNIFSDSILLGVGIKRTDSMVPNKKSIKHWNKVLSKEYIHSVRDDLALDLLTTMGFKAINTGCPTLWMLNESHCKNVPQDKSDACIFSLTSENIDRKFDAKLARIVLENYSKVYFWVQRWTDDVYLSSLVSSDKVEFIYDINEYDSILNSNRVDYVGTRLHGGIFALQHKKRAIVVSVDHRAECMARENNLSVVNRKEVDKLPELINSSFKTDIHLNVQGINEFMNQFMTGAKG